MVEPEVMDGVFILLCVEWVFSSPFLFLSFFSFL